MAQGRQNGQIFDLAKLPDSGDFWPGLTKHGVSALSIGCFRVLEIPGHFVRFGEVDFTTIVAPPEGARWATKNELSLILLRRW